ncbi:protein translocase subunit SecF [Krasilnikovia sp. MM14-A1004]|uniref:protein translocase subunit SecF n=1 Tax=Krasilnikovia sp. MM14-A1004 TaxID=3373541 RepID=UPI00399D2303
MAKTGGFAYRLYRGEANLNIIGRRKTWFLTAALLTLVAIGSFIFRGFELGIEFEGGTAFNVPATAQGHELTQTEVQDAVSKAVQSVVPGATTGAAQKVGRNGGKDQSYTVRAPVMTTQQAAAVKATIVSDLKVDASHVSDSQVSAAWGGAVTRQALIGLAVFLVLVMGYLVIRFEWRMAVAAVSSLLLDLVLTAGVYSLIGFEVTPSTVIGFLTILGFSLYDVVVVFDKVQENTRGITAGSSQTYGEATNLAVNQTLMRSINTGLVALLPVGGLLFIGAGLLGAGTLKDLGLVLFVGMGIGVAASILFAAPLLSWLKDQDPRIKAHTARVLSRRASGRPEGTAKRAEATSAENAPALAGSSPRPGARPAAKRTSRGGRPGATGNRPGGGGKRR